MCGINAVAVLLSLLLHLADQASDVFVGFLFYFEGQYMLAGITLGLVLLPGFCIFIAEMRNTCRTPFTSFCKAVGYLFFTPIWAILIHLYSLYDKRYIRSAYFFKTMEGFIEAGPQLVLQLSLLFLGSLTRSSHMVLQPALSQVLDKNISLAVTSGVKGHHETTSLAPIHLDVFGRTYEEDDRYWFGVVHVFSVLISFISILSTCVIFNDLDEPDPVEGGIATPRKSRVAVRVCCGLPFFFFTLMYRTLALSLIICYLHIWSGIIIFIIFFGNVLAALYSGDNFARATTYALWSMLVPAGYNQNPSFYLGYKKVPVNEATTTSLDINDKDIERVRHRAKYFLSAHVLSSIFLVGGSFVVTMILVMTHPEDYALNTSTIFSIDQLPLIFLPILGMSLALSVLLVRPYHRCDCSGGDGPPVNGIV